MEAKVEVLKDKIEELRSELNQAISDKLPADEIYRRSVALDKLIEQYIDLSQQHEALSRI